MRKTSLLVLIPSVIAFLGVITFTYAITTISTTINTGGTLNVDGATTLNGNVALGDAKTDAITVTGYISMLNSYALVGTTTEQGASILTVVATSTAAIPLTIVGYLNQAANLFQINSSVSNGSTNLLTVSAGGNLTVVAGNITATAGNLSAGGTLTVAGASSFGPTASTTIGADGRVQMGTKASVSGKGLVLDTLNETTAHGLAVYTEVPVDDTDTGGYNASSIWGRTLIGETQTATFTMLGAQNSLVVTADKNLAGGQHFGSLNVLQTGATTLSGTGENGGVAIALYGGTLTVDSTAFLAGLLIDNSATVANSGTFDAIYIKAKSTKWANGIEFSSYSVGTDIKLQNGATISNATTTATNTGLITASSTNATTTLFISGKTKGGCIQLRAADGVTIFHAYATTTGPLMLNTGACGE